MTISETTGRCQCGACGFAFVGAPAWVGHCHCESCRRAASAPFTTYVGVSHGAWRWTGATPTVWESSPGQRWHRCPTCGSLMAYASEKSALAHEIHFMRALIEAPGLTPTERYHWDERVDWAPVSDDLRKHPT